MALKSTYTSEEKGAEIEEALDTLDKLVDRVKVLYEQYFMGIQKQPPTHLHTTLERQLRDLTQQQIRNTALRYRFVTLQQKHGAYNSYWKRTLREIEAGRYVRNLARLRNKVARTGEALPEEILAKMPKRMRDAIARDRELALAAAQREGQLPADALPAEGGRRAHRDTGSPAMVFSAPPRLDSDEPDLVTQSRVRVPAPPPPPAPTMTPRPPTAPTMTPRGTLAERVDRHLLDDILDDDDIDAALAALADEAAVTVERRQSRSEPHPARPSPPPSVAQPIKVVPPIKIVTPGYKTPATGVPAGLSAPLRTPPLGVPMVIAESGSGPNRVLPPIPRVLGLHAPTPPSGVQPAASPSGVQAALSPSQVQAALSPSQVQAALSPSQVQAALSPSQVQAALSPSQVQAALSPSGVHQAATPPAPAPEPRPPVSRAEVRPPAARPTALRPDPGAPSIPGMSESDTRALYAKYVKARTLVGEATEPMTYERMVKTLSSQAPKILRDHHSTGVEFNVVVRDNKVVLKAKPK